jgi:Ca2+-binding EF-hand superfamily protein
MISKLDENGDDKLSFDEINNRMAKRGDKMFDRMDRNDDGTLSADELARMEKRGKHKWHKSDNGHDND